MRPDEPSPGFPRPYPHIPPEILPPPVPERPIAYPGVPTVWMPDDDLRSRVHEQLLARRTVFLERPLDAETATFVVAQLMTLDADAGEVEAAEEERGGPLPVTLVVNSPGGPLDAVSAVLDTIDLMRCPVATLCLGQATGTAAVVVAAGSGRRRAGPSAQFRLRLPDLDLSGRATQLSDEVAYLRRAHDALLDRLVAATAQDRRLIARDIERGRVLTADEALTYGLIDEISARP